MVFNGQKTCLGTMKNLYKTIIKTVTKDTYPKEMKKQHSDLPFLQGRMKIDKCKPIDCHHLLRKQCHDEQVSVWKDFGEC